MVHMYIWHAFFLQSRVIISKNHIFYTRKFFGFLACKFQVDDLPSLNWFIVVTRFLVQILSWPSRLCYNCCRSAGSSGNLWKKGMWCFAPNFFSKLPFVSVGSCSWCSQTMGRGFYEFQSTQKTAPLSHENARWQCSRFPSYNFQISFWSFPTDVYIL